VKSPRPIRADCSATNVRPTDTTEREVRIAIGAAGVIVGNLHVPPGARGLVIFAHGSGSSRLSPRNRYVAEVLERAQLATLLIDLLTAYFFTLTP
jgi:putative phosphoribosyl transferase